MQVSMVVGSDQEEDALFRDDSIDYDVIYKMLFAGMPLHVVNLTMKQ